MLLLSLRSLCVDRSLRFVRTRRFWICRFWHCSGSEQTQIKATYFLVHQLYHLKKKTITTNDNNAHRQFKDALRKQLCAILKTKHFQTTGKKMYKIGLHIFLKQSKAAKLMKQTGEYKLHNLINRLYKFPFFHVFNLNIIMYLNPLRCVI